MTMFLVFWCSEFSNSSEDICICKTEEIAKAKIKELGGHSSGYHYKEIEFFE